MILSVQVPKGTLGGMNAAAALNSAILRGIANARVEAIPMDCVGICRDSCAEMKDRIDSGRSTIDGGSAAYSQAARQTSLSLTTRQFLAGHLSEHPVAIGRTN